jgi:hypothetical protein
MTWKFRLNPHGIVAVLLIILMFGIAFYLNWNIDWWYFSVSVVLYSAAVIFLTLIEERSLDVEGPTITKWLIGCHLSFLFFAVGLFFPGQNQWLFVMLGIFCGPAISFLLLRTSGDRNVLHLHGLIALLLIIIAAVVAFFYLRNHLGERYAEVYLFCVLSATLVYVVTTLILKQAFSLGYGPSLALKLQLGCHLAFILMIVGFVLPLKNPGSVIAFFVASIAVGLAMPFLLLRSS